VTLAPCLTLSLLIGLMDSILRPCLPVRVTTSHAWSKKMPKAARESLCLIIAVKDFGKLLTPLIKSQKEGPGSGAQKPPHSPVNKS
jgi:hypothetical protein